MPQNEKEFRYWVISNSGWILVLLFSALPIARWLLAGNAGSFFSSPSNFFDSLGKTFGLVGFVLYAINLLLAARTKWMENFFGGLNRVYIAHHITGAIALVMVLFHPFFLAIRYFELNNLVTIKESAKFLLPRGIDTSGLFTEVQEAIAFNSGIIAFWGMTVLLILTFFIKLPYRIWLITHRFLGAAFLFAGAHIVLIGSDVSSDNLLKLYMLFWTAVGISAFVYRTLMGNILIRREPYEIEAVKIIGDNVVAVQMKPMKKPLNFKAGQFVFVRFLWSEGDGISREAHPFSIASSPKESGLRLYMKSLGDFTSSLKALKTGTIAEVEGAYGKFGYNNFGDSPQIWIAGGIGITPFLSMARSYDKNSPSVDLYYSVVHSNELIDQTTLDGFLPKNFSQYRYFPYIGDAKKSFLNVDYIIENSGGVEGKHIFICGPPPMMKSLKDQLRSKGVPKSHIHTEEFSMQ